MVDAAREAEIDEALVARIADELRSQAHVLGAIWVGSRSRAEGIGESSDIDLIAIIDEAAGSKWRRGFRDADSGRHVELLYRPASLDRLRFRQCAQSGESWPHGYATGRVLFDNDGTLGQLVDEARELWRAGPDRLSEGDREWERYEMWLERADIVDRQASEPEIALHLIGAIVRRLLRFAYRLERRWYPPDKYLLRDLAEHDDELAGIIRRVYADRAGGAERLEAVDEIFTLLARRHHIDFAAPYVTSGPRG
jgi:hypothetical protein